MQQQNISDCVRKWSDIIIAIQEDKGELLQMKKEYRNLADLPNTEGFCFTGILDNGDRVDKIVRKNDKGLHYVDDFKSLMGWLPS